MEKALKRLCLILLTGIFGSINSAGSFSVKSRVDQLSRLKRYEITLPRRLEGRHRRDVDTLTEIGHIKKPSFVVQIEGEEFILDLYLNDVLFADGFLERSYSDSHIPVDTPPERNHHCYYQGHVRGHSSSRVALSTCNGLSGVIVLDKGVYYIQPLSESDHEHLVYRSEDVFRDKPIFTLEDEYPPQFFQDGEERMRRLREQQQQQGQGPGSRSKRDIHSEMKYIELILVADKMTFDKEGSKDAVFRRCKEIANIMDVIYQPLNTRVALVHVEVWNQRDEFVISAEASMTLGMFQNWRRGTLLKRVPHDNAQLLTGIDFNGATVGMAGVSTMCAPDDSCGVSQDHGNEAADVASTMAHELGHNLGMHHDKDGCDCDAFQRVGCVMSASSGSNPPFNFSSCSEEYFRGSLEQGLGACMFNYPKTIFQGPICQNGFLEEGEECDCGKPEYCTNKCCVPETCKLHKNATCAIGECCHNCQLKKAGEVCRDLINECDLPEYCTGSHEECPPNVYRQNGIMCTQSGGATAACYNGRCLSYDEQCVRLWGPGAQRSHDDCWLYNREGNAFGNCGFNENGQHVKCPRRDWYCGKLYCEGGARFPLLGSLASAFSISRNGHECKAAKITQTGDQPDPGYVAEGSPCADNMICYQYQCVNHSMAGIRPCQDNCNNRGICNSHNNCHCNEEWSPPLCLHEGSGGSIDSGPAKENAKDNVSAHSNALLMIILLVLLIPAFVVGVIVAIWKRDWIREKINTLRGEPSPKRPPPPKPAGKKSQPKTVSNGANKFGWPDEPDTTTSVTAARKAPTRPAPGKYTPGGNSFEPEVAVVQPSWKSQPLKPVGQTSAPSSKPYTPAKPATTAKPNPAAAQRAALKPTGLKPTVPKRPVSGANNNWNNSKLAPQGGGAKPIRAAPAPPKK